MPLIKTTLTNEEKTRWKSYCDASGMSDAAMLRTLVRRALTENNPTVTSSLSSQPNAPRTRRISFNLSQEFSEKLRRRMEKEGYTSPTNWATSCVMASLSGEAVPSLEERTALEESNRQILAIGRNLNQLARAINSDPSEASALNEKLISALSEKLRVHVEKVSALLEKSRRRFRRPRA